MLCLGNTLLWTWWQAKRIIIPKPSLCLFLKINYNLSLSQSHLFRLSNSDLLKLSLKPMNQSFSLLSPYVCIKIFSILNQKKKKNISTTNAASLTHAANNFYLLALIGFTKIIISQLKWYIHGTSVCIYGVIFSCLY